MALRLRRGTNAERALITPAAGELIYVTDFATAGVGPLWVGDGTTLGGIEIESAGSGVPGSGIESVADDTTPALGGNLDLAGQDIVGTGNINITGNVTGVTGSFDDITISGAAVAASFKGNVLANDGSVVFNFITKEFTGLFEGDHSGTFYGSVIGNTQGAHTGSVSGNVTGNLVGNVFGNVTGNLVGDIRGSVFGDDSSLLIDGNNGLIVGDINSNNVSVGSENETLDIYRPTTGIIRAEVPEGTSIQALSDRFSIGSVARAGQLRVISLDNVSNPPSGIFATYRADEKGNIVDFLKSRGDGITNEAVADNDILGTIRFQGDDGTSFTTDSASISSTVNGTVSSGVVPGRLTFKTASGTGALSTSFFVDSEQIVNFVGGTEWSNASYRQNHFGNQQTSRVSYFQRSRGTSTAPAEIQNDDHIYTLRFTGYDGSNYQTVAQIRGEASANIDFIGNPGVVPGRLRIMTSDTAGIAQTAMLVGPDQSVQFNARIYATTVEGDLQGSLSLDDSTVVINAQDGQFMIGNVDIVGETGNTPTDAVNVDSWLQVTVNGATKFIPLYD